ncbi:MAG TPA: ABC transporter permease [Pseudobacteroides sp.]|nr:ABC transporter permease [Pseudobacteroides sp.]
MGLIQAYKMAIKSILSNKVRSFLTMLGVIIGVGSVIAAVAFAQGSTKSITDSLQGLGTNLISISITGRNSNRNITYEDLQKFSEENSDEVTAVAPQVSSNVTVKVGTKTRNTSMVGTSPEYEIIKNVHVQSGRFLLSFDLDYRQKIAIIGTAVANDVFEGRDPVGQTMKINGQIYTVVGLLAEKAGGQDQSEDDQVIIPVTSAQRLSRASVIRNFSVQAATPEAVSSVMEKLNEMLQKTYNNTSSYRVFNQEEMLSALDNITGIMMLVLGGIAAISLLVGGIGIMNIMLVSVTERTREIGIRKAIGAKRRSILVQFMIEAAMVTGIGGIIGVLLGLGVIKFVIGNLSKFNSSFSIQPVYSLEWIMISFGISLVTGIVFGLFPAYKAARLNPIQALRFE